MEPSPLRLDPSSSPDLADDERVGRVARVTRAHAELLCSEGEPVRVHVPRRLRGDVVVGDWAVFSKATESLDRVLPRRTELRRRAAGDRGNAQVVCANVDIVFITTALDGDFSPRRLERYLSLVHDGGAEPVVLLTKAGLVNDREKWLEEARRVSGESRVLALDVFEGIGLSELQALLEPGITVAFVGSSGVGKSTLVNSLLGREAQRTNSVREFDARGRHTTTSRELFVLSTNAALIDTPGLREVGVWTDRGGIDATFADVQAVAERCRFRDCQHSSEPGCAVREAVERGELDAQRVANYVGLHTEAAAGRIWERRAKERRFGRMQRQVQRMKRNDR